MSTTALVLKGDDSLGESTRERERDVKVKHTGKSSARRRWEKTGGRVERGDETAGDGAGATCG